MRSRYGLFFAVILGCWLTSSASAARPIRWQADLEAAKRAAARSNRLVLVHFWADWCGPCKEMDTQVFSRQEVAEVLEAHFVPVRLNRDHFPQTVRHYNVSILPCDVIITPQGQLIERIVGVFNPSQYTARLYRVAARTTDRRVASVGQAPAMGPPAGQGPATNLGPGVAGYDPGENIPPNRVPDAEGHYVNRPKPAQPSDSSLIGPRYGRNRATSPEGIGGTPQGDPLHQPPPDLSAQFQGPPTLTPGNPALQGTNRRPDVSLPGPGDPRAGQPNSASRAPAAWSPGSTAQLPAGNPPLAMDGYCPVQLTENERWVVGDPRWGLTWRGRTYLFSGPDACDRFDAAPDRYAPVLSGNDIVLAAEQGRMVPGRREYGAWASSNRGGQMERRVYLFSGEATYGRFQAAPDRYVNALRQLERSMAQRPPEAAPVNSTPGSVPVEATLGLPQRVRY
jgi:protein disulfide-isomerase